MYIHTHTLIINNSRYMVYILQYSMNVFESFTPITFCGRLPRRCGGSLDAPGERRADHPAPSPNHGIKRKTMGI